MYSPSPPPLPAESPVHHSYCDVCSVVAAGQDVTIAFGQSGAAATDPRAVGVARQHRVVMAPATAAKLRELMLALLSEASAAGQRAP